jgi:hypothetical protein
MGLVCQHCSETAVPFEEIPAELLDPVKKWGAEYGRVHSIAHWDDRERRTVPDYQATLENAASDAERLLKFAHANILPRFLDFYPAIIWEDQDECLEVRPDDLV